MSREDEDHADQGHDEVPWNHGLEGPALGIAASRSRRILVEAGPGTGKTFTLRRRVLRLLQEGVSAESILAVTFTRTAARDLQRELDKLGSRAGDQVHTMTLHSLCFKMLGGEGFFAQTGRVPRPLITASKSALLGFEAAPLLSDLNDDLYRSGLYATATMKSKAIRAFEAAWAKDQSDSPGLPRSDVEKQIHRDLTGWLTFHRAVLIGELIPLALGYLRNNPQAPEIGRYTHVLVDEYQDLTKAEQVLVDLLTTQSDCMVVGDRNQSVYSFRYAKRDGLSDYAARHPGTQASDLSLCRRCPTAVVGLASELIANNPQMDQKTLTPDPTKDAGFLECRQWPTLDDQVEGATRYVQWLMRARGIPPGEILVISPSRQIGYAIRDNLVAKDVTALSYFAEEALEELEAQTNFALLSLLANPEDRVSLRYWLGVGSGTHNRREYARLRAFCGNNGLEPMDALAQLLEQDAVGIPTLLARYSELQRQLVAHGGEQGQSLLDSLFPPEQEWAKEIRSLAGEAVHGDVGPRDLHDLLRDQVAQPGLPMQVSHVRVMSLHKAKGLTARAVVIAGCVNGLIPRAWSPEKSTLPTEDEHRQEQRRLFYVALTRTTEHLLICGFRLVPVAQARRMGMPDGVRRGTEFGYTMSSFLSELGDHLPAATTSMSFG